MSNLKKVRRLGITSPLYCEVFSSLSLPIGIVLALLVQPGRIDKTGLPVQEAAKKTAAGYAQRGAAGFNWWEFFRSNLTLQVLLAAIVVGIIVSLSRHREQILSFLEPLIKGDFLLLKYVMYLAPIGAFVGMPLTIVKSRLAP